MRLLSILLVIFLTACTTAEREVVTTSVDVNQTDLPALLADLDALAENELDVDRMLSLAVSTPMDQEQQDRFAVTYDGTPEEILVHIWREQVDWVHLYFSSESQDLIDAIEQTNKGYARQGEN